MRWQNESRWLLVQQRRSTKPVIWVHQERGIVCNSLREEKEEEERDHLGIVQVISSASQSVSHSVSHLRRFNSSSSQSIESIKDTGLSRLFLLKVLLWDNSRFVSVRNIWLSLCCPRCWPQNTALNQNRVLWQVQGSDSDNSFAQFSVAWSKLVAVVLFSSFLVVRHKRRNILPFPPGVNAPAWRIIPGIHFTLLRCN